MAPSQESLCLNIIKLRTSVYVAYVGDGAFLVIIMLRTIAYVAYVK